MIHLSSATKPSLQNEWNITDCEVIVGGCLLQHNVALSKAHGGRVVHTADLMPLHALIIISFTNISLSTRVV